MRATFGVVTSRPSAVPCSGVRVCHAIKARPDRARVPRPSWLLRLPDALVNQLLEAAVLVLLQQRLAEVLAEQDSRNRLHQANGRTLPSNLMGFHTVIGTR